MNDLSGSNLKGYEIEERIGAGGFGAVYKARQSTVGREVAIKVILPGYANQPDFIRRFETEAQTVARLEHMHIVPLYDFWRDPEGAYIVMRRYRGGSLRDALSTDGRFEPMAAAGILNQIASGLALAHRNQVIHRDLKPGNILLDEDGNGYLADFGIAKDIGVSGEVTEPDQIIGSPDYLAPEQARSESVTPQTDIYSLGVVLYELLTGQHPFPNISGVERLFKHLNEPLPTIEDLDATLQSSINEVIQKATQKNPLHRYADVIEMAAAFHAAVQQGESPSDVVGMLTPREQEILQLIMDGLTNRQIAERLFVTLATIKWYIRQLLSAFEDYSSVKVAPPAIGSLIEPLSDRELEVLQLVAEGLSNREIGKRLFLALDTVKGHNRRIYAKLGVQRRTEAVARASELGLI